MFKSAMKRDYTVLREWKTEFGLGLPILMYHKVMTDPRRTKRYRFLYISPALFARQMAELRAASFTCVHLEEAFGIQAGRTRKVVLTFDDAFRSVFENALGTLTETSFRAITYVVADRIGGCNEWDQHLGDPLQPLMSAAELKSWISAGHEIGSHTNTHPNLTRIPLPEAREEIRASKRKLEDIFGVAVTHFCYPYGAYNQAIRDFVEEAGYRTGCTTSAGVNHLPVNRFELKRLTARYASRSLKTYWRKIREAIAPFQKRLSV